ncbi:hypothetical protein K469DRAFT_62757 [Zopfia rhizophila CBS 207.26]|uniref:Uncharacterized protein n=1 Tax=Zopfia rhizophila CBS 207.26 TaxID=1314779 RepID=A0A6A6EFH5_9PEZI|nr:hypothetical protein K469DRAFT_62757 [Zopfia rhizophila CBS 207.26]
MGSKPCWFLAPRASHPDGPIKLGSILISPIQPEGPLYDSSHLLSKSEHVTLWKERDFKFDSTKENSGRVGIWASFLQLIVGIGGDASVGISRSGDYTLTAERMTTKSFIPSQAYIEACIQQKVVRTYITESRFRNKIYIIVGTMIASGASGCIKYMKEHDMGLLLGFDGTPAGVPLSAGPEVEFSSRHKTGVGSKDADDFVFAYRLREIKVKNAGKMVQRVVRKGALFEGDGSLEDYEGFLKKEEETAVVEVVGLSEDDVTGDDFDYEAIEAVDEANGEDILCYSLEE